jgi:hypothetical protein
MLAFEGFHSCKALWKLFFYAPMAKFEEMKKLMIKIVPYALSL